jgi:hypothetical protein
MRLPLPSLGSGDNFVFSIEIRYSINTRGKRDIMERNQRRGARIVGSWRAIRHYLQLGTRSGGACVSVKPIESFLPVSRVRSQLQPRFCYLCVLFLLAICSSLKPTHTLSHILSFYRLRRMVRVAVTQQEPLWLDLAGTVDKTCRLIEEAAQNGAQLITFPEVWITGYPMWIW